MCLLIKDLVKPYAGYTAVQKVCKVLITYPVHKYVTPYRKEIIPVNGLMIPRVGKYSSELEYYPYPRGESNSVHAGYIHAYINGRRAGEVMYDPHYVSLHSLAIGVQAYGENKDLVSDMLYVPISDDLPELKKLLRSLKLEEGVYIKDKELREMLPKEGRAKLADKYIIC